MLIYQRGYKWNNVLSKTGGGGGGGGLKTRILQ